MDIPTTFALPSHISQLMKQQGVTDDLPTSAPHLFQINTTNRTVSFIERPLYESNGLSSAFDTGEESHVAVVTGRGALWWKCHEIMKK